MNREHLARDELLLEIKELRAELSEARATVDAIRRGHVDAVVVEGPDGERQIFTLRGADHTYRALVEGMHEGALTLTTDGAILYCNQWFAEMVGAPLEQVIGSSILRFISDADVAALEALLHNETRGARREVRVRAADDALVPATLSMNTLETEDVPVLCLVATDLRQQKRNEEMVASERLARSILDQAAEAIVVCDDRGTIVRASQLAHELCGKNPLMRSFEAVFPLRVAAVATSSRASASRSSAPQSADFSLSPVLRGERLMGVDATLIRSPGQDRHLLVSAGPLRGSQGQILGCVVTLADITERRRMEGDLRLQGRLLGLGQLASGVAHDFRSCLNTVTQHAEMSLEQEDLAPGLKDDLEIILDRAEGMAELVQQMTDKTGRSLIDPQIVDLGTLVQAEAARLSDELPPDVRVRVDCGPGPHPVLADEDGLHRVLTNLTHNARDAMPDGGELRLQVSPVDVAEDAPPRKEGLAPGRWVRLRVSDTGTGMTEETLRHLFEPFFTTKEVDRGIGLGLSQAHGIVRQHGGWIGVDSEQGQGTTIDVYLPADQASRAVETAAPEETSSEPTEPRGVTILLVEGSDLLRQAIRQTLESLGHHVVTAACGSEALALATSPNWVAGTRPAEVIVTALSLPDMAGQTLVRRLTWRRPGLKAVGLTSETDNKLEHDLYEAGFADVIQKPFEARRLKDAIRDALNQ